MTEKKCCRCKRVDPECGFNRNSSRADGLQHNCRECQAEIKLKWKKGLTREKRDESNQRQYAANRRKKCRKRLVAPLGCTYLVTDGTAYKVGITKNIEEFNCRRLRQLQNGNPREIKLLLWSEFDIELAIHYRFSGDRLIGEWFTKSDMMLKYFKRVDSFFSRQEHAK